MSLSKNYLNYTLAPSLLVTNKSPLDVVSYNITIIYFFSYFLLIQFLWRLGTVGARVISLTAYAAIYKYWVLLVLGLHWLSMLLWLHSPKNVFHGERMSPKRKAFLFALLAFVFTFEYVNLLENNHREKMVSAKFMNYV